MTPSPAGMLARSCLGAGRPGLAAERRRRDGWSCGRSNLAAERRRRDGCLADAPVTRRQDAAGTPADAARCHLRPMRLRVGRRLVAGSDAQPCLARFCRRRLHGQRQCASLPGLTAVCVPPSIGFSSGYCALPGCSILGQNCRAGPLPCASRRQWADLHRTCDPGESSSCRTGYVCQSVGPLLPGGMHTGCLDNTGCPTGTTCFPVTGSPVGQCRDSGSKVGDSCAVASDCPQNGLCVPKQISAGLMAIA